MKPNSNIFHISGIQQVGIGNPDVHQTWKYYRQNFGFDTPVFEEEADAPLMKDYTGGEVQSRNAVLCLNMNGGGGLEIWQFTKRKVSWPKEKIRAGDLGINSLKIKCKNIYKAFERCESNSLKLKSGILERKDGSKFFILEDLHANILEVNQSKHWFSKSNGEFGGVMGLSLGVSNMELSLEFYDKVLGFSKIVWDESGSFPDLESWTNSPNQYRRVLLERSGTYQGAFSQLLGPVQLELVQSLNTQTKKIFENRFWGDPGFIHLCFDIVGMDALKEHCTTLGHPFTVDSAESFDMGEAAGRFSYIEDPDGTLIEFVETHKVPIIKKLGWYLNLQKINSLKPLPRWMIKTMGWSRIKD